MSLDLPTYACPTCYKPQKPDASQCDVCGQRFAEAAVLHMTLEKLISIPNKSCPRCVNLVPEPSTVCKECGHAMRPGEVAPTLDPAVQIWAMGSSYYESDLYGVVPASIAPESIGPALGARGFWGELDVPRRREAPGAAWELHGLVVSRSGPNPTRGTTEGEETGWEVNIFPANPSSVRRELVAADPDVYPGLDRAPALIGVRWCEGSQGIGALGMQLSILRAIAPGVTLDATAGRLIQPGVWPQQLADGYSVRVEAEAGVCWLHTQGLIRWGAPELEWFDVPEAHVQQAIQELHAAAATLSSEFKLPPLTEPFQSASGRWLRWAPFDAGSVRGAGKASLQRKRFPHGSVTLSFAT